MSRIIEIENIKAPGDLTKQILFRLKTEERRKARFSFVYTSVIAVTSMAMLYPITSSLIKEFAQSGFNDYMSLLFSTGSGALTYWKEFTLTLGESFPVFGVITLLAVGLSAVISARTAFSNSKVLFNKQLA